MLTHPLIGPAYYIEEWAFNPRSQPSISLQKEVLARIAAIVAPFFYLYQICTHGAIGLIDAVVCLIGITDGNLSKHAISSVFFSIRSLFSSLLEIPHKFVNGPTSAPNYFGNNDRHHMLHHGWQNKVVTG